MAIRELSRVCLVSIDDFDSSKQGYSVSREFVSEMMPFVFQIKIAIGFCAQVFENPVIIQGEVSSFFPLAADAEDLHHK